MSEAVAEAETPQITLVDLQNILRIIDVSAERGAFKGNELTSVGGVRDKLAAFLEHVLPKEEEVQEEPAPAPKKTRKK
jgi:hypothetical protein